jgi:phosphoadenosine phosphosulfate reductase
MPTVPLKSGDSLDGFEFCYPIENWSHDDVLNYLQEIGAPLHPCYAHGVTGVDCLHCTAWWNESHLPFIKERYPSVYLVVREKIKHIQQVVTEHMAHLQSVGD